MIPYDKLTIVRNRTRARDLRVFRELVETYFEKTEYVANDRSVDWEGARAARSRINQMLPRVIQIVHAAGLDAPATTGDVRPLVADVTILRNIFGTRHADGTDQEIVDIIDMALGVYEDTWFGSLVRTINPFHYALRTLGYIAGVPRRAVIRSCGLALLFALGLLLLQELLLQLSLRALAPPADVALITAHYFHIRIWAAPATLLSYAITGVLFGLARVKTILWLQLLLNISNAILNVTFVIGLGMGVPGVAQCSHILACTKY